MVASLPKGWIETTLGEIAEPLQARALPSAYPAEAYVGLEHVEAHTMTLLQQGIARDVRSLSIPFSKGDILYGKMRPYLNKIWIAEFGGLCSSEFLVFPNHRWLNNRFLALRMNADPSHVLGSDSRLHFR